MSVFHLSKRLMLLGSLAAAMGAGAVQAQPPTKYIPVQAATDAVIPADSIVTNTFLSKDTLWILKGFVLVKSGVTLTIEAGTTIQSDPTVKGTLMVDRGGYLVAAGTAAAPITFQGPNNDRGTWGGLVLLGKSYSNQSLGGSNVQYEALDWANYAGTDDNDSSGVLTYLRLINPGYSIVTDRELNGLTLCAVGSRTVINHIQVHRGDDDGIEWFGGTVNTSHLVVTNAVDDSYDTDNGYSGNSQYMIAIQSAEANRPRANPALPSGEVVGDRGLECGSSLGAPGRNTNPVWKNITFIENGRSGGAFEAKEECGGTYEKMVLVAGGISADTSDWAINLLSPRTVNGVAAPTPYLDFKKTFITGKYRNKYVITGTAGQIATATAVLNAKIKAIPFSEINGYGLNKDLSASHPAIIDSSAGAIVGNDLWYQGWTIPGTVEFPLGDALTPPNAGAPTVTLVSDPATLPYAPATFTLNATAADPDGISKLEILKDGIAVASSQTASVSHIVTGAAKGAYTYTVRAIDNHAANKLTATQDFGFMVPFKPNSAAPSVTFTQSTGDAALFAPAALTLNAAAVDADGIDSLQILQGNVVLKTGTGVESLSLDLSDLGVGNYIYTVRAKDAHGDDPKITSKELKFEVKANKAPVITITPPPDNLKAPAAFTLTATAHDSDGAIASMQILEGAEVLGSFAGGAVSASLADKPEGIYTYTVKATDNNPVDPKTVSLNFTVIVSEPASVENKSAPVITLARGDDDPLVAPASFKLFANAGDADEIDTLEVLLDGVVVKTGTTGSLEIPITGLAAGTYTYTARAKDKHATDPKEATKELEVVVAAPVPNAAAPTLTFAITDAGTLLAPASFTLYAGASDADGIDTLEILRDGVLIERISSNVLSVSVEDLPPGHYVFTARAKDKHAGDPKETIKVIEVDVSLPTAIAAQPLRDLSGLGSFSARGQDLLVRSEGYGKVHLTVMSLSGRRVASRSVNLLQGQNAIPMGNLRGVHVVLVSNGKKARTTRVVFSAGR